MIDLSPPPSSAIEIAEPSEATVLLNRFRSICVAGSATLKATEAFRVSYGDLPAAIRSKYIDSAGKTYVKLNATKATYIIVGDDVGSHSPAKRICSIVGRAFTLGQAWANLSYSNGATKSGERALNNARMMFKPEDGYAVVGGSLGDGFVNFQVITLGSGQLQAIKRLDYTAGDDMARRRY